MHRIEHILVLCVSREVGEGAAAAPRPGGPDAALVAETWRGLDGIRGGSPRKTSCQRYETSSVLGKVGGKG
jgi:hypothetical protein